MSLEWLCNKIICFSMSMVSSAKNAGVEGFSALDRHLQNRSQVSVLRLEHDSQLFVDAEIFLASDAEFVEQQIRQRLPETAGI